MAERVRGEDAADPHAARSVSVNPTVRELVEMQYTSYGGALNRRTAPEITAGSGARGNARPVEDALAENGLDCIAD